MVSIRMEEDDQDLLKLVSEANGRSQAKQVIFMTKKEAKRLDIKLPEKEKKKK